MPEAIQTETSDSHKAQLEIEFQSMSELLKSGPLLVGEDHSSPAARSVIKDLVSEGNVRSLWLEAPKWEGVAPDQESVMKILDNPALGHKNSSKFVALFRHCRSNSVLVYHWDHKLNFDPKGRSPEGMAERNECGAELFSASNSNIGAILLAGSYHFLNHHSNNKSFQKILNITEPRVFDLSMYN